MPFNVKWADISVFILLQDVKSLKKKKERERVINYQTLQQSSKELLTFVLQTGNLTIN